MKTTAEETREFNFQIALSKEEWEELERYAGLENKDLQQYLLGYFELGVATAQREGYIYYGPSRQHADNIR